MEQDEHKELKCFVVLFDFFVGKEKNLTRLVTIFEDGCQRRLCQPSREVRSCRFATNLEGDPTSEFGN